MYLSVYHRTRFRYSAPITESITEVRMSPRNDDYQFCLKFDLKTSPQSRVFNYTDGINNVVHYFDIPGRHSYLNITAEAIIETTSHPFLPASLHPDDWAALDQIVQAEDHWEMLLPSQFTEATPLLVAYAQEVSATRRDDPLTVLRQINEGIYHAFDYVPKSTKVDSSIDDALTDRKGVCQDFTHIMLALVRRLGIPCRYVSGYLFHQRQGRERSAPDATHAWVEALLPNLGWVGFDPTNNVVTGEQHIKVAVGRDYADVPPTKGVFKGVAESELSVDVRVTVTEKPVMDEPPPTPAFWVAQDIQDQQQQQQ
jgi:transglutaminase-like putative cysteine protease